MFGPGEYRRGFRSFALVSLENGFLRDAASTLSSCEAFLPAEARFVAAAVIASSGGCQLRDGAFGFTSQTVGAFIPLDDDRQFALLPVFSMCRFLTLPLQFFPG